jgi:hypothetical protein
MFTDYDDRHTPEHPGSRRLACAALLGGLAMLALASCVYDSNNRCGPHQVLRFSDVESCVCDEHSVGTANGCVPCATNEIVGPTGCECAPGYGKAGSGEPCTLGVTADAGAPNDQGDPDTPVDSAEACTSNSDCTGGDACDLKVSPSVCRKPPLGLGKACSTSSDCAGTEATFCDAVVTKACTVEGCSLAPDNCFPGYVCCDLSKFGIPTKLCAVGQCL